MIEKSQFANTFENILSYKLTEFTKCDLTLDDLHRMRDTVSECFLEALSTTSFQISIEAAQWAVCKVFENIQLTNEVNMRDLILMNNIEIEHLASLDIMTLRDMFEGMALYELIQTEFERRMNLG